jgi:hypothetical protein
VTPSSFHTDARVRFPPELDPRTLASLVLRVAQHAQWDPRPMELRRQESDTWAEQTRCAAVLAGSGILRSVILGNVLSLTLSLSSAALLDPAKAKGRALRARLVDAVRLPAPATCDAVLELLALAAPVSALAR